MHLIRLLAVVALVFVVQVTLITRMSLLQIHPDSVLPLALAVGITGGRNRGALAGFAAGLFADAFMVSPMGLSALAYTLAAYAAATFAEDTSGAPWVNAFIGTLGAVGAFLLLIIVGTITGDIHTTARHGAAVLVVEALTAAIATPIAAWGLRNAWRQKAPAW